MLKLILPLSALLILSSCGGQGGGLAPSHDQPQARAPITDTSAESNIKFGSSTTSANGWTATLDTTDPVQTQTLSNGWTVEVKYE